MKLKDIYNSQKPIFSFEIFPPKAGTKEDLDIKINDLFEELKILAEYNPAYISVTYGAGGSTRETTFDLVIKIKNELKLAPMPHFTCVGSSKTFILQYLKKIQEAGIDNILALRGDPPKGEEKFIKPDDGFGYANELVNFIKSNTDMGIAVAGYPECHQECCSLDIDIQNLKKKVDSGADIIITQLFYDNNCYFEFVDKIRKKGINIPVIPGILPITTYSQIERIVQMSGCKLPEQFKNNIENNKNDKEALKRIGIDFAVEQCSELLQKNAPGIHFYTLNKAGAVKSVLEKIIIPLQLNKR